MVLSVTAILKGQLLGRSCSAIREVKLMEKVWQNPHCRMQSGQVQPLLCTSHLISLHPINSLPLPGRYHNGSLLDPSIYKYKNNLVLKNLNRGQAGEYFCKASSDGGSAKSQSAKLSVIGKKNAHDALQNSWGGSGLQKPVLRNCHTHGKEKAQEKYSAFISRIR